MIWMHLYLILMGCLQIKVYVDQHGMESVCCNRADGLAFDALRKLNIPVYILSTESNPVVATCPQTKSALIQGVKKVK